MKQGIKKVLRNFLLNLLLKGKAACTRGTRAILRRGRLLRYAGNRVECPFCRKTFSKFRPTGVLDRPFWKTLEAKELRKLDFINVPNALCPWCGSGGRKCALFFYLRDNVKIWKMHGARLLDIAPDGFLTKKFFSDRHIEYVFLDISSSRNPTVIGNATQVSFADYTFDGIICYHVLEHIPNEIDAIGEMYRVLRHGGWAIVQVPIWARIAIEDPYAVTPDRRLQLFGHKDHVRRCGPDYQERLRIAGLSIQQDDYVKNFSENKIKRYGLFQTEDIWFCVKHYHGDIGQIRLCLSDSYVVVLFREAG